MRNIHDSRKSLEFPQKLFDVLLVPQYHDIVRWLPGGKAFVIIDKKSFISQIVPKHFKKANWTSFTRKLNRWKFSRVSRGPLLGAYYHALFRRDNRSLCRFMSCNEKFPTKSRLDDELVKIDQVAIREKWDLQGSMPCSSDTTRYSSTSSHGGRHDHDYANSSSSSPVTGIIGSTSIEQENGTSLPRSSTTAHCSHYSFGDDVKHRTHDVISSPHSSNRQLSPLVPPGQVSSSCSFDAYKQDYHNENLDKENLNISTESINSSLQQSADVGSYSRISIPSTALFIGTSSSMPLFDEASVFSRLQEIMKRRMALEHIFYRRQFLQFKRNQLFEDLRKVHLENHTGKV